MKKTRCRLWPIILTLILCFMWTAAYADRGKMAIKMKETKKKGWAVIAVARDLNANTNATYEVNMTFYYNGDNVFGERQGVVTASEPTVITENENEFFKIELNTADGRVDCEWRQFNINETYEYKVVIELTMCLPDGNSPCQPIVVGEATIKNTTPTNECSVGETRPCSGIDCTNAFEECIDNNGSLEWGDCQLPEGFGEPCGTGACFGGEYVCSEDGGVECSTDDLSSPEICGNGEDEDCDGEVDEGCPPPDCITEGESGSGFLPTNCCPGLVDHSVATLLSDGTCAFVSDTYVCIQECGDGNCTLGENSCNCPEDCS